MAHYNSGTMTHEQTQEQVRAIKRSFRLRMNGEASRSMRDKGAAYKLNWGISLVELRQMATELGKDYDLSIELWKEPVRECRILATLVMPAEKMLPEIVDVWMEQIDVPELAELLAHNLLQHVSFAPTLAFEWIAGERSLNQLAGYDILAALFSRGSEPNERGISEFLDQAQATLESGDAALRRAAYNAVVRFCGLGEEYERIAQKALPAFL